jgi:hypothetical protein
MAEFLNKLDVTPEVRSKLAHYGARSPRALLAVRNASPDAFDHFMGALTANDVAVQLDAMLSDEDRAFLERKSPVVQSLGALLP